MIDCAPEVVLHSVDLHENFVEMPLPMPKRSHRLHPEVDSGKRAGISTDVAEKLKALERENRELRQANEILRKASAYFAQAELDRPLKR